MKRTQIICIHEGEQGRSIDPIFVNAFFRRYDPSWLRPWGTSKLRLVPYGGKTELKNGFASELKSVGVAGADITLMVLADVDDLKSGSELKELYRKEAESAGISREEFDKVVFILPKYRIENWIQFLNTGFTDESVKGPRIHDNSIVKEAARKLADMCRSGGCNTELPTSLEWSCREWKTFIKRME